MATTLKAFLETLINDPALWAQMRVDPRGVMTSAGLSQADQDLLMNGPVDDVRKATGKPPEDCTTAVMVW